MSPEAELLLSIMRAGTRPVVRATTGRADYYLSGFGDQDCTKELLELKKLELVKIVDTDERVGWFTYGPEEQR